ncbi:MAG: DUF362 domain-containing protein [Bryobacteraceae bacterium]
MSRMDRREFLGASMAAALAPAEPSRVVIARDPSLHGPDEARVEKLLDRAVQSFFGRDNPLEAWKLIARPGETVGLKVNCLAGRGASTRTVLVEAVIERLQQAGIRGPDIVIWDRLNSDLESAGFPVGVRRDKVRFIGNDSAGYEDDLAMFGSAGSLLSLTLTRQCHVVINLPVLKDHGIVGVTMALKNMFGAIHNPNKYHLNAGDPYVADVYALPAVRQKVRLTICDALTAQYEGGPSYMPQWSWPFNGVFVATDPVALDTVGWQIIEAKRKEMGFKSLQAVKRAPNYIATAADAQHRLGTNDVRFIRRVEV